MVHPKQAGGSPGRPLPRRGRAGEGLLPFGRALQGKAGAGAQIRAGRERIPLPPRREGALQVPPGPPLRLRPHGPAQRDRLRTRRVPYLALRGQFQLAGTGVDAAQLPFGRIPRAVPLFLRGRLQGGMPHGLGTMDEFIRSGPVPRQKAGPVVPARRPGQPALSRRGRALREGPGLEGPGTVLRIFQRRQRQGPGCQPPDWLDRPGGEVTGEFSGLMASVLPPNPKARKSKMKRTKAGKPEPSNEWWKPVLLLAVIAGFLAAAKLFHLGGRLDALETWIKSLGPWGPVVYTLLYAAAVVAALPVTPFAFVAGVLFGTVTGVVVSNIGVAVGACLAFLAGR